MKIFLDTEFIDDGSTIDLISIALVRADGTEYYAVVKDGAVIDRAVKHEWLRENVVPYLPVKMIDDARWRWDDEHPDYEAHLWPRKTIAQQVEMFIRTTPKPELWAWYSAYDHVALAQLFGSMQDLPEGVPMLTFDLKQEHVRLGSPVLPRQSSGEHNALADARHNQVIDNALARHILGR